MWVIRACTFVCQIKRTDGPRWYKANYSSFSISDEAGKYRLSLSGYSGDAGDAMANPIPRDSAYVANGMKFTTRDQDNDEDSDVNCATRDENGGWWYNMCSWSVINADGDGIWDAAVREELVTHSRMWLQAPGSVTFILFLCLFVCHVDQGSRGYRYFCVCVWMCVCVRSCEQNNSKACCRQLGAKLPMLTAINQSINQSVMILEWLK